MTRQTRHIRILILETDEPHPSIHEERGGYASILDDHFRRAAEAHDPPLTVECDMRFVVEDKGGEVPSVEAFEGYQGVLLTGSLYDAHSEDGWVVDLMERLKGMSCLKHCQARADDLEVWIRQPRLHFSGVCFGHQLICRMLGSTVSPHPQEEWEIGHNAIDLTPIGQDLFRTSEKTIHLHQMHQDSVQKPPSPSHPLLVQAGGETDMKDTDKDGKPVAQVHVWGSSEHTAVQGIYIPQRVFTTQAHLAFDGEMVKREIEMRIKSGSIRVDENDQHGKEVEEAEEWADAEHDGGDVARAILRFFAYEDDGLSQETQ